MSNTITNVLPKMLAQGVLALRQNALGPRLVNRSYESIASQKGNVVNVPIPSAIAARAVTPSITMNSNVDSAPTVALVTLDHWFEAPFQMSDNDAISADGGMIPMQASEAVKALANDADNYLWGKHVGFYNAAGVAGTTPSSIANFANARKLLNKSLAPTDNRFGVLDPDAENNFLTLANILQADQRGDAGGIIRGEIATKLGVAWYMDQNITSYSVGGAHANGTIGGWAVSGANAVAGVSTITVVHASATGTIKIGDIFTVGGSAQQYVITAASTITVTASETALNFYPALATTVASAVAVTFIGTNYVVNLVCHRDAFAFASRPLGGVFSAGNVFQAETDPISGIALRLELSRQYKQETFSFDYLCGANVVRRELGAKILG